MSAEAFVAEQLAKADANSDHRDRLEKLLRRHTESLGMFHMLCRQMQAAYAAGVNDGPAACMEWLGNALAGPGNLPLDEHPDPDWYASDAWTPFGEYGPVPPRCRTANEPGEDEAGSAS